MDSSLKRLSWFAASLGILAITLVSCGDGKKTAPESEQAKAAAAKLADKEQIAALAKRHGALTNWQTTLQQRGMLRTFTYDLKKALMPSNGAPVLLVMTLDDVSEQDGGFQASFSNTRLSKQLVLYSLVLDLSCTAEQGG